MREPTGCCWDDEKTVRVLRVMREPSNNEGETSLISVFNIVYNQQHISSPYLPALSLNHPRNADKTKTQKSTLVPLDLD